MRLLLDQGLPRSAAAVLRDAGVDATHVGDIGAARASDAEILKMGRELGSVVVTLDADFHALLAVSGDSVPSVIRIRIEGLSADQLAALLLVILKSCGDDLEHGSAVTVQHNQVRVRRLPIAR